MTAQPQPPLEVGTIYEVSWEDCCTAGQFVGAYKGIRGPGFSDGSGDPDTDCDAVVFATGEVTDGWNTVYRAVDRTLKPVGVVFEVLESVQPHNQGWSSPPDISHGLFADLAAAERKLVELAGAPRFLRAASIKDRTVLG